MRTGNPVDGMYFLLLAIPFVLSIWFGDQLRKSIVSHLALDSHWSQSVSAFVGISVEILIILTSVSTGFLLVKLI